MKKLRENSFSQVHQKNCHKMNVDVLAVVVVVAGLLEVI